MGRTVFRALQSAKYFQAWPVTWLTWCVLLGLGLGQQVPPTVPTTTPDDGDFFDEDNNKAMYLVLPAMILIYGGCAFIYCVHRCRRYCTRKSKAKAKEEKRKARQKERVSFSNPLVSCRDLEVASSSRHAEKVNAGHTSMQLQSLEDENDDMTLVFKNGRSRSNGRIQETNVDAIEDCLQIDSQNMGAVAPGYADGNLSQEMMHLDNQLKAAFRLTQDASKTAAPESNSSKPDGAAAAGTTTSTFTFNKDDKFSSDSNKGAAQLKDGGPESNKPVTSGSKVAQTSIIPIAREDIESILKIRKKVKKPPAPAPAPAPPPVPPDLSLRSQPDLAPQPDENVITIRRVHIKTPKDRRRFYLSSQ